MANVGVTLVLVYSSSGSSMAVGLAPSNSTETFGYNSYDRSSGAVRLARIVISWPWAGHDTAFSASTRIDHGICDINCWIPSRTPSGLGFSEHTSGSRSNVLCR